jgi:hypothetical protein
MKAQSAVLNEVTGIPGEREKSYRITEIATDSGTYLVQSVENGMCLMNPGLVN